MIKFTAGDVSHYDEGCKMPRIPRYKKSTATSKVGVNFVRSIVEESGSLFQGQPPTDSTPRVLNLDFTSKSTSQTDACRRFF
jgi:hypothetical protein